MVLNKKNKIKKIKTKNYRGKKSVKNWHAKLREGLVAKKGKEWRLIPS